MNSLFVCKRCKKLYQKYIISSLAVLLLKWVFSEKDYFRKIFFHCLQYYCWKSFFLKKIISEKSFFIACKGFLHFWLWWNLNKKASACFCMFQHSSFYWFALLKDIFTLEKWWNHFNALEKGEFLLMKFFTSCKQSLVLGKTKSSATSN